MVQLQRFCLSLALVALIAGRVHAQTAASPDGSHGTPTKTAPVEGAAGTSAVVLDVSAVDGVIGKSVKSYSGEDLGHIVDLLVTPEGQMRAAILQFGGVLGVGDRRVAVAWATLDFKTSMKGAAATLALTRNQVRVAPEYKPGDPVVILEAAKADAKPAAVGAPGPSSTQASPADASRASPLAKP